MNMLLQNGTDILSSDAIATAKAFIKTQGHICKRTSFRQDLNI